MTAAPCARRWGILGRVSRISKSWPAWPAAGALALAVAAAVLGACGGDNGSPVRNTASDVAARTSAPLSPSSAAKIPPALAANATDANRIVGKGKEELRRRLDSLKGYPVVINQWASWCGPCRFEFPFFAAAVDKHQAEVAFVGLNFMDSRDAAEGFVSDMLPGFPSVFDPDGAATRSLGPVRGAPTTFFIGSDGRKRHTKYGGYASAAALETDIRRYALGAGAPP